MQALCEKNFRNSMIEKPDFSTRSGRELLAFYLHSKFKKIIQHDKTSSDPIFTEVKEDFFNKFFKGLIHSPKKRILIAITGESACGKTTICNKIKEIVIKCKLPITLMSADNYFNDISDLIKKHGTFDNLRDAGYDVDNPSSFQLELLKNDLIKLSDGIDIKAPQYLVDGRGISVPEALEIKSRKIIIVEGMASLYNDLSDLFDIKIYIETEAQKRKTWFIERAASRNQDMQNALKHWNYVLEAGEKYVKPYKDRCDVVVNGAAELDNFAHLIEYINHATNSFIDN